MPTMPHGVFWAWRAQQRTKRYPWPQKVTIWEVEPHRDLKYNQGKGKEDCGDWCLEGPPEMTSEQNVRKEGSGRGGVQAEGTGLQGC